MSKLIIVVVAVMLFDLCVVGNGYAAVLKDQTCTRKSGTTYQCSAKQETAHQHIVACGKEWQNAKSDPAVKAAGWPAFWHTCSDEQKKLDTAKRD